MSQPTVIDINSEISGLYSRISLLKNIQDGRNLNVTDAPVPAYNCPNTVHVIVLGASGDLAKRKIFPALYYLFKRKLLPTHVYILGFARTEMTQQVFSSLITSHLDLSDPELPEFLARCAYLSGPYDSIESFDKMDQYLLNWSQYPKPNKIYYMALPPDAFESTAMTLGALCHREYQENPSHLLPSLSPSPTSSDENWTRIIIEKPFGRDLGSCQSMNQMLLSRFSERQLFRIDHYLGKEMVQSMLTLRFANATFEPIWNNRYIANVSITFKEDFGIEGRAGYFDRYGIIRDVMQNHLLQIMSLIAMEPPVSLQAEDLRDEKVKVLRSCLPLKIEDVVVGQYGVDSEGNGTAYLDEFGIPHDSLTPTFATAVIHIHNSRWSNVPFILKCGKGLNERKAEVRIQFKPVGSHLFPNLNPNELVFKIQPNEAIYLKMMNKVPGLTNQLTQAELDLTYKNRYSTYIPDAYERLILDVFKGDRNLFVRDDELEVAWQIISPALLALDRLRVKPITYIYGSRGPLESDQLASRYGYVHYKGYNWPSCL